MIVFWLLFTKNDTKFQRIKEIKMQSFIKHTPWLGAPEDAIEIGAQVTLDGLLDNWVPPTANCM